MLTLPQRPKDVFIAVERLITVHESKASRGGDHFAPIRCATLLFLLEINKDLELGARENPRGLLAK